MKFAVPFAIAMVLAASASTFAQGVDAQPSPAVASKIKSTVFILDEPDQYCSVSPITHDGYMITALHCLRDCLLGAGAAEAGSIPFAQLDLFVAVKPAGVVCRNVGIPALGVKTVTVVETGPGVSVFDAHFLSTYTDAMTDLRAHALVSRANDFAILKVALPKPISCWPLAPAQAGAPIWAVGYPRPDDPAKQKPILTSTPGRVYGSALESRAYAGATSAEEQTYLTTLYSDPAVLYSNASTSAGQSGGPVIDASGALVGVISGYTSVANGPTRQSGETHELVAAGSASILKALSPGLQAKIAQAQCR